MPHEPDQAMAAPPILRNVNLDTEEIQAARIDLAASIRMSVHLGLNEGICNHFSAVVPGHDDLFMVNPYGLHWSEITASSIVICDHHRNVLAGSGKVEDTAFYIHGRLHLKHPRAKAAFHTHMPYATALCMIEGPPLLWAGQSSLKFYGRTAVDEEYGGLALDAHEGDRMAACMGNADILFLKNHGVMVVGPTIAEAWDDLYYLERAAEAQVKAMSTGRPLKIIPHEVAQAAYEQQRAFDVEFSYLHLESVKRRLAKTDPDFLD